MCTTGALSFLFRLYIAEGLFPLFLLFTLSENWFIYELEIVKGSSDYQEFRNLYLAMFDFIPTLQFVCLA